MQNPMSSAKLTQIEWLNEGKRLFGMPVQKWKFQCPVCKHVQTMGDFEALHIDPNRAYQECVGRHIPGAQEQYLKRWSGGDTECGPCDYAAYGLFKLGRVVTYDDGTGSVNVFPFFIEENPPA